MYATKPAALLSSLLLIVSACSKGEVGGNLEGRWKHETFTEGSRRTVRTLDGSVWGGRARLVEELSIGTRDGPDPYLFGSVRCVTASADRIFVVDPQVPAVRVYDNDGNYLSDLGREGEGPGEYRFPCMVAVDPVDGSIFVEDYGPGKVLHYTPDGTPLGFESFFTPNYNTASLMMTRQGVLWMIGRWRKPGGERGQMLEGAIRWEPGDARRDTLAAPEFDFEQPRLSGRQISTGVPYWPDTHWMMIPSGAIVGGVSNEYRLEVRHANGGITVIEKYWDPVPIPDGAKSTARQRIISMMEHYQPGWRWNGPAIPDTKPAFKGFFGDYEGRIWVIRHGESVQIENRDETGGDTTLPRWEDTLLMDVFEETGQYLGEVEVPTGLRIMYPAPYVQDDIVLASLEDEEGVPYVKRYRLILP